MEVVLVKAKVMSILDTSGCRLLCPGVREA
jgi:hypothetical protein